MEQPQRPLLAAAAAAAEALLQQQQQQHATLCDVVIKLGGAAITDKSQTKETLRPDVLAACASAVCAARDAGRRVVVVHGAGSFGHALAHAHGVATGGRPGASDSETLAGFAATRASVARLNGHVVAALLDAGVPATGLSLCGAWSTRGRRLPPGGADVGLAAVAALLSASLVPVLHGDAVLDAALGVTVLGGDAVVAALASAFLVLAPPPLLTEHQPPYVVFLTAVDGVFSAPPGSPGAELLREIRVRREDGGWRAVGGGNTNTVELACAAHDVTGGVQAKVAEAAAIAAAGVPVVIARAGGAAGAAACVEGPAAFRGSGGGGGVAAHAGTLVLAEDTDASGAE